MNSAETGLQSLDEHREHCKTGSIVSIVAAGPAGAYYRLWAWGQDSWCNRIQWALKLKGHLSLMWQFRNHSEKKIVSSYTWGQDGSVLSLPTISKGMTKSSSVFQGDSRECQDGSHHRSVSVHIFLPATMWTRCRVCWFHTEWSRRGSRKWQGTYWKMSFRWIQEVWSFKLSLRSARLASPLPTFAWRTLRSRTPSRTWSSRRRSPLPASWPLLTTKKM